MQHSAHCTIEMHNFTLTEAEIDIRMREEFSKVCFETLLQFSFSNKVTTPQEGYISRMALSVLLKRSQDVLHRYIEDERLSGKCPLPRYVRCLWKIEVLPRLYEKKFAFRISLSH